MNQGQQRSTIASKLSNPLFSAPYRAKQNASFCNCNCAKAPEVKNVATDFLFSTAFSCRLISFFIQQYVYKNYKYRI